jgi:hypothetical protein
MRRVFLKDYNIKKFLFASMKLHLFRNLIQTPYSGTFDHKKHLKTAVILKNYNVSHPRQVNIDEFLLRPIRDGHLRPSTNHKLSNFAEGFVHM